MRPLPRLLLLGLILGGYGNRLRAEEPVVHPTPVYPGIPAPGPAYPDPSLAPGGEPFWPAYPGVASPGGSCPGCEGGDARHPAARRWLLRPVGCWTTHQNLGCGSLKSECIFLFGSCRQFFGEPCLKGPPPLPPYPY